MMKIIRSLCCLLLALSLLPAAAMGEETLSFADASTLAGQGGQLNLTEVSLIPEDCSGFEVQAAEDQAFFLMTLLMAMPSYSEDGTMCSFVLPEAMTRELLENAEMLSMGPGGAILYFIRLQSGGALFVRRDKTLTLLSQSEKRGAADQYGNLKNTLDKKLNVYPTIIYGDVRWSPDGRYLFICDTDKWFGVQMEEDDPYLLDTFSGDIFLLETNPSVSLSDDNYRFIVGGRFSADSRYFDYVLYVQDPDSDTRGILMRYNLEAGTAEIVYQSPSRLHDLALMGETRWLVLESGDAKNLLWLDKTGIEITEKRESLPFNVGWFRPVSDDMVLYLFTMSYPLVSLLLPIRWESTGPWMKIENLSSDKLVFLTAEEAKAAFSEAAQKAREKKDEGSLAIFGSWPGFGHVKSLCAINGTSCTLLYTAIDLPVSSNWPGRSKVDYALLMLDTKTMKYQVIYRAPLATVWDYYPGYDDTLYGDSIPIQGRCFLLSPAEPEGESVGDSRYGSSEDGEYLISTEDSDLILTPIEKGSSFCKLDYSSLTGKISVPESRDSFPVYRIDSVFTRFPEPELVTYRFPEAISEERLKSFTSAMSKATAKKTEKMYTKISPAKLSEREDAAELLACYPALAEQTLYIYRYENDTQAAMERAEGYFREAGYTPEDFELDSANVAVSKGVNTYLDDSNVKQKTGSISYSFNNISDEYFTRSRVIQLANLCDRINSAVYLQYLRPEGEPLPIESLITETYEIDGTVWHVTLERMEDSGESLTFTLDAYPES